MTGLARPVPSASTASKAPPPFDTPEGIFGTGLIVADIVALFALAVAVTIMRGKRI